VPVRKTARYLMESVGLCPKDASTMEGLIGRLVIVMLDHPSGGGYRLEVELQEDQAMIHINKKPTQNLDTLAPAEAWYLKPLTKVSFWMVPAG